MKIVHIGNSSLPVLHLLGGANERRIRELSTLQAARGDEVVVYTADRNSYRLDYCGVQIRGIACRRPMPLRDFEFLRKIFRELRTESADVLHFHGVPEGAFFFRSAQAKKFLTFDYFIFRRGKKTPLYPLYRRILGQFSALLPVSEYCRRSYEEYWGSNGVPIRVVYNGVNLDQFKPDPVAAWSKRKTLGLEGRLVILYVGRVCHQKGTDILIEAYQLLKHKVPDLRLVVAGPAERFSSTSPNDLTRRISEAGGMYLGPVPESELSAIYNLCDVFVMPTRSIEMFGMAAVEAQACGKPVVCSRHGGLTEVVSEVSGAFFPVGDASALSASLRPLLAGEGLRRAMGEQARENARKFAWSRVANKLHGVYGSLGVSQHKGSQPRVTVRSNEEGGS